MPDSIQPIITTEKDPTPYWYQSKKLWATVVGTAIAGVTTLVMKHGGAMVKEIFLTILPIIAPIFAYIFGQAIVDAKTYPAIINANGQPTDQPK